MTAHPMPLLLPIPEDSVHTIRRASLRLGLTALVLGVAASPALVLVPTRLVPFHDPTRSFILIFATLTAVAVLFSAGGTIAARAAVATGQLNLWHVRFTRALLMFGCALATLGAVIAGAFLALIVTSPPERLRPEVRFDVADGLYLVLLTGAVALTYVCYFGMRGKLWRSRYALRPPSTELTRTEAGLSRRTQLIIGLVSIIALTGLMVTMIVIILV